jgi:hypothetical protein
MKKTVPNDMAQTSVKKAMLSQGQRIVSPMPVSPQSEVNSNVGMEQKTSNGLVACAPAL